MPAQAVIHNEWGRSKAAGWANQHAWPMHVHSTWAHGGLGGAMAYPLWCPKEHECVHAWEACMPPPTVGGQKLCGSRSDYDTTRRARKAPPLRHTCHALACTMGGLHWLLPPARGGQARGTSKAAESATTHQSFGSHPNESFAESGGKRGWVGGGVGQAPLSGR